MAQLKPNESFVERIIREAMERGEFDDLPGAGRPIPGIGTVDDEGWWIRRWVERNRRVERTGGNTADRSRPHRGRGGTRPTDAPLTEGASRQTPG